CGTVGKGLPGRHTVVFLNEDVLGQVYQIFSHFTAAAFDRNFPVTAFNFTEAYQAIDFSYHSGAAWVPCFEELSNTWQTAGDIPSFTGRSRDFHEHLTCSHFSTVFHSDVSTGRDVVVPQYLSIRIQDADSRVFGF